MLKINSFQQGKFDRKKINRSKVSDLDWDPDPHMLSYPDTKKKNFSV
jgi:hypothetical protein